MTSGLMLLAAVELGAGEMPTQEHTLRPVAVWNR